MSTILYTSPGILLNMKILYANKGIMNLDCRWNRAFKAIIELKRYGILCKIFKNMT
jgi:hypothetical protein